MANEIKMPQLSDTMDSGKILSWKKNIGDAVARGDILAEVETDKANLEIESFQVGTLLEIKVPAGNVATVGEIIAVIGQAGESVTTSSAKAETPASEPAAAVQSQPAQPQQSAPVLQVVAARPAKPDVFESDRIKVSPLARKIAEQKNIELSSLTGSGPHGRIIRKDVDDAREVTSSNTALAKAPAAQPTSPAAQPAFVPSASGTLTAFSKMRDTIARRMQESVREAPHFFTTTSIEMSEAKKLREILKERAEYKGISINHLVIKAVAYAIEREPRVNNTVRDNQLYQPGQINIGIITAIEDGLLIPVIKEANTLSLKDVAFEAKAAVERARAGRPNSSDLSGGTFSISNMGMFDVESFTAIINPGQGSILAVSSIKEQPVVKNGQIVVGQVMKVTISVDHRIIDGVMAGTFLKYFKEALETPALLMI